MTLFCSRKQKRHSRSKVSSVQYSRDDNSLTSGKKFAVVLQSFDGSVSDELSVSRGQVVEKLCADREWIYVRNVDGRCGYIPHTFCYGMDQVMSGQHWATNDSHETRSQTSITGQRPKSIHVNTLVTQSGSQSSVEVHSSEAPPITPQPGNSTHSQPPRSSTPVRTNQAAERLETPDSTPPLTRSNRRLSSLQPSAELVTIDTADSAIVEEPRYVENPHGNGVAVQGVAMVTTVPSNRCRVPVRRSLSMNDSGRSSCRTHPPNVQRVEQIQRSISYQEAVLSAGQDPYGLVAGRRKTSTPRWEQEGHVTPPQRLSPMNPRRHQRDHVTQTFNQCGYNCEGQSADFDPADDVFLPEPKKPVGIFRCLQTYKPKYEGELSVKEGELVILLEFGRGDWAWILTSMNQEGLLPRRYLVRYNPRLGVGGPAVLATRRKNSSSNASTQTELVVDGGCIRHVSGASSASAGATAYSSSSSSCVTTPPLTQRVRRHHKNPKEKEVSKGGERCVASSAVQTVHPSPQWFENLDSLERRPRPTNLNCSAETTPLIKHRGYPNNVVSTPQSVKSADCYLGNRTPNPASLLTPKPVKSADYTGTASAATWFNSISSTTSSVLLINQAPTLTAIRDYSPPPDAKNCLRLSKGDVLNAQPHMHYPKGWMWVWHKRRHSFGYVPQSHVGYTYAINKGERSRTNTIEDAV